MARGGRPGDDDPGALLFGDDDYDDERQEDEENESKAEPQQGSLWGDHAQDDEERAPTQPIVSPVEDLRYQGPISMDDADEPEDGYEDPGPGTGRVFFAAALIGGVIITMFAVALYYRGSSDELVASTVAKAAGERRPAASAPLTQAPPAPVPSQTPESNAASAGSPTIEYRPVSEAPVMPGPEKPSQVASVKPSVPLATGASGSARIGTAAASTAQERPAPVAASHVTPAKPAETSHPSAHSSGTSSLNEIARRGRNRLEAAPAGSWTVQVIVACQPVTVEKAFRNVESTNLVAIPVDLKGQSCYRLCWGLYSDRAAAERAITSVPDYFAKDAKPQPVPVTKVVGH